MAHVSTLEPSVGDIVKITSTRPISKRKRWRVVELIRKTVNLG
ncbi:MAG: 30S ribosomal protein S17 [Candidatus Marinimicrobia bacterium]|nr:30S ribosomal protein S17 [Candidatus Neomarinimicrobiota bacterium]